ncbi:MAG: lipoprotein [Rickettsiales bacterium]|nr:lipoprotein [Rickettsiales bacterium]
MTRFLLVLSICVFLANCGTKGDLYLPQDNNVNSNSLE